MLGRLPKLKDGRGNRNPFVFASLTGKSGRITDVRSNHARALRDAGINELTIHGLRRSFSLLERECGLPLMEKTGPDLSVLAV
jgi:integrase